MNSSKSLNLHLRKCSWLVYNVQTQDSILMCLTQNTIIFQWAQAKRNTYKKHMLYNVTIYKYFQKNPHYLFNSNYMNLDPNRLNGCRMWPQPVGFLNAASWLQDGIVAWVAASKKVCPWLIPRTRECTLIWKRVFADVIKIRILRWKDHPRLSKP